MHLVVVVVVVVVRLGFGFNCYRIGMAMATGVIGCFPYRYPMPQIDLVNY
jgi:hypothetical protein